jgi:hypothetical protein
MRAFGDFLLAPTTNTLLSVFGHRQESSPPSSLCSDRGQCRFLRWRREPPRPFPRCCEEAVFSRLGARSARRSASSGPAFAVVAVSFSAFRRVNQAPSRKRRHSHSPGLPVSRIAASLSCRPVPENPSCAVLVRSSRSAQSVIGFQQQYRKSFIDGVQRRERWSSVPRPASGAGSRSRTLPGSGADGRCIALTPERMGVVACRRTEGADVAVERDGRRSKREG